MGKIQIKPPKLAEWLLKLIYSHDIYNDIHGDLLEMFEERIERVGSFKARLFYWKDVMFSIRNLGLRRGMNSRYSKNPMIGHYLLIATRNIRRNWRFSLINIFGLSIGIAVALFILLYVTYELSYDNWHSKADRIFRITMKYDTPSGYNTHWARIDEGWINNLPEDIPEVDRLIRFQNYQPRNIKIGNTKFKEEYAFSVDADVFEVFDFDLYEGNPKTALLDPYSMVLTENTAIRYFGKENPMGKEVMIVDERGTQEVYKVTGLMRNLPLNTHLSINLLTSFKNPEERKGWAYTYLLLTSSSSDHLLNDKLPGFIKKYAVPGLVGILKLPIQPLTSIHLESNLAREIKPNGRITYLYIFSGVGLFVLAMAIINFVNLNTVQSLKRIKQVGIRKVLGSNKQQLVAYFMIESVLVSTIASVTALVVLFLISSIIESSYQFEMSVVLELVIPTLMVLILIIGFLSGYYPSFILSGLAPTVAIKGQLKTGQSNSKFKTKSILVAIQITICIILISSALITRSQFEFLVSKNIGINTEQVLAITNVPDIVTEKYKVIKSKFKDLSSVKGVSASMEVPSREIRDTGKIYAEGIQENRQTAPVMDIQVVDQDFIEVMNIELIAGRNFSDKLSTSKTLPYRYDFEEVRQYLKTQAQEYILNETALKLVGWSKPEEALGKQFRWSLGNINLSKGPVVGIIKDFHQESLRNKIDPIVMVYEPVWLQTILIKIDVDNIYQSVTDIESTWNNMVPDYPMEYAFLDDLFDKLYHAEKQQLQLIYIFSGLALIIAFLGIFSLISFTLKMKVKEIAIRRVLGATLSSIAMLLSREYIWITIIAMFAAVSLAWWGMNRWLETFAYRIQVDGTNFLLAMIIILVVIVSTITIRIYKLAVDNPANTLRND